jgi:hypothetical protein
MSMWYSLVTFGNVTFDEKITLPPLPVPSRILSVTFCEPLRPFL